MYDSANCLTAVVITWSHNKAVVYQDRLVVVKNVYKALHKRSCNDFILCTSYSKTLAFEVYLRWGLCGLYLLHAR